MASTTGIYGTVIKKIKLKEIAKRILGVIAFASGVRIFTIDVI